MTPREIEQILKNLSLVVDTREQPNNRYYDRINKIGFSSCRQKLDFGDYSVISEFENKTYDFTKMFVIERKMSIDEIAGNLTRGRKRLENEFKRAKEAGAKMHLIIENGSFSKIIEHRYRSKMTPNSLLSSLIAFADRYNLQIHFCRSEDTPLLIRKILYFSVKNYLDEQI